MGGEWVRARVRPYAFEREEMTAVTAAEGSRGVPAASSSAWRFVPARVSWGEGEGEGRGGDLPDPEMRTVMRRGRGIVFALAGQRSSRIL